MTPSRAQLIRDWLATQTEPKSGGEIAAAIGMGGDSIKVHWTVSVMFRDGMLERVGAYHHYRYALARNPEPRENLTPEESMRRRRERQRQAGRDKGARPLHEHMAFIKARAAERQAAKDAERQARRDRERSSQAARKAASARIPKPKVVKAIKPKWEPVFVADVEPQHKPKADTPRMSVDEFIARGGKIDRLPTSWAA